MTRQSLIEPLESRLLMAGVVSGDFTGDGRVDIVTTQGGLKLRVGNGNGTFRTGVPINGVGFARGASVAAADFNNDGSLDLAVFGGRSTPAALKQVIVPGGRVINGGLFVLLNNGDGTFQRAVPIDSGLNNARRGGVATGDFNGDGNQDILVAGVAVSTTPATFNGGFFLGTSFGVFASSGGAFFVSNTGLTGTTGGNLLGTGTSDLLGGSSGGGFLGTTGTFTTPNPFAITPPSGLLLGSPATHGASTLGSVAFVIDGNGNGTFQPPQRVALTSVGRFV